MEIIAEKEAEKQAVVKQASVKTEKTVKKASIKAVEKEEAKVVKKAAIKTEKTVKASVEPKKETVKDSKEYNLKNVKVAKNQYTEKLGTVWKKLKSKAALSSQDRGFLFEYFKKYYPADYVEALIAQY